MKTEKNRTAKKLYEWMWFFITLSPFIFCFLTSFNDSLYTQSSLENAIDIYVDFVTNTIRGINGSSFIGDFLSELLSIVNADGSLIFVYPDFVVDFAVYLISVEFIRIIIDLLLWVPRFLQKQLNKGVK